MKYTLLEIVQLLLSALDSDEANSIDDTTESYQVALLLKSVYYDCATDLGLPEHELKFELNASGDALKPTLMTVPTTVTKVSNIFYNTILATTELETTPNYQPVEYMPFDDFLRMQQGLRNFTTGAGIMTFSSNNESFEMMYRNDKMPQWWTSYDDNTLLFDSYLATEDTTLQKSKTMCQGTTYPTFTLEDSFIPDLDPTQFSYYINRAKVRAFAELKQAANQEAASEARRQKIMTLKNSRTVPNTTELDRLPNYGRRNFR